MTFAKNIREQLAGMAVECVEYDAVPVLLIAIDRHKKGHMFWPDDLPDEMKAALPEALEDVRDALAAEPLT